MKYVGMSIAGLGFVAIGYTLGWLPTLGVLLVVWGNNVERTALQKERDGIPNI